jgi:hypothetical protein
MKDQHNELCATQLSPEGRILSEMLKHDQRHVEKAHLMAGHSFGSVVADARRRQRIRVRALLDELQPVVHLDADQWNEFEHDRADPSSLGERGMEVLARALSIDIEDLHALAAKHLDARREERRLWEQLAEEAHAFRRRRNTL